MQKFSIAGLNIDLYSKQELLFELEKRIQENQKTWITTLYSEFLFSALRDKNISQMLNRADIALTDGVGILWAKQFLAKPIVYSPSFNEGGQGGVRYWFLIFKCYCQALISLLVFPFQKKEYETLPGSNLVWDLSGLAVKNNWKIFLLGGFGDTPKLAAEQLLKKSKNQKLRIQYSNKNPEDVSVVEEINKTKPDILLVAYGPLRQEQWIAENLKKLSSVKLAVGVGGTFDYIAKKRINPPEFVRKFGFEWLFRLVTQPWRLKRIFNATFGLVSLLVHFKVFESLGLRPNVAVCILNGQNRVLVCRRNPKDFKVDIIRGKKIDLKDYWQLPQGGVNPGEELAYAANREAQEETGIKTLRLIKFSEKTHNYKWNNAARGFFGNANFRFSGQSQKIAYMRFLGDDGEIKLDGAELVEWKWVEIASLPEVIHLERNGLTGLVVADLKEMSEKGII